tara:strand:- start:458 stop:1105 length:648 start_codon:yes stop_codon:yes gene_type:complete
MKASVTPTLYHGPEARTKACAEANRIGRMLCDPIGDGGLKTDDAREAVRTVAAGTFGDAEPTMVIGPLCTATPEAADALLKTLEDLSGYVTLCLWADCIGEVVPTIRSRTNALWCPATPQWIDPVAPFQAEGDRAVGLALQGNVGAVLRIVEEHGKAGKLPSREGMLLRAMTRALEDRLEAEPEKVLRLWGSIRKALRNPTPLSCCAAMVEGVSR